jgi:hypothetical protein
LGTTENDVATEISLKRILVWLAVIFVIVSIWADPRGTAQSVGPFLSDVGHFLQQVFAKVAAFLSGLWEDAVRIAEDGCPPSAGFGGREIRKWRRPWGPEPFTYLSQRVAKNFVQS